MLFIPENTLIVIVIVTVITIGITQYLYELKTKQVEYNIMNIYLSLSIIGIYKMVHIFCATKSIFISEYNILWNSNSTNCF